MDTSRLMTPQAAEAKLLADGFIRLPPLSYIKWIESDWFERYKRVLSFKNGAWLPNMNRLAELSALDEAYKEYQWKRWGSEQHAREENQQLESLVIADPYINGAGDPTPF